MARALTSNDVENPGWVPTAGRRRRRRRNDGMRIRQWRHANRTSVAMSRGRRRLRSRTPVA